MGQLNADLDYESALETAEKLVESDTTGFAKFDVAVLKDRKGEADEALRLLDEVIAASVPASIPALDAKLSVLTRQNRGLELESYLRENWKDTVETIPYAAILGRLLLDQGQLEEIFKLNLAILRLQKKSAPGSRAYWTVLHPKGELRTRKSCAPRLDRYLGYLRHRSL